MKDQRAKFESRKAFAGEKKPSMQRRCVDHDYTARRMYMVTMVTAVSYTHLTLPTSYVYGYNGDGGAESALW